MKKPISGINKYSELLFWIETVKTVGKKYREIIFKYSAEVTQKDPQSSKLKWNQES